MSKKIFVDLINEIKASNDQNINAAHKETIHELLQVYFYRLTKQELFELAELAFRSNKNNIHLFKIALTCYTLAIIKTDVNSELNSRIFTILGKEFGKEINAAKIMDFNGHVNEPYSTELSKIEKLITANAFIGEDVSQLVLLSNYYFSLALAIGNKECILNPTINALERRIGQAEEQLSNGKQNPAKIKSQKAVKADGNPVYLWKSISYLSLAVKVTRNPNQKLEFQLEKLMRLMHVMMKFYLKKDLKLSGKFARIYDDVSEKKDWVKNLQQTVTSEQNSNMNNNIYQYKEIIKKLNNEKINTILENAEKRENDIMGLIFHVASEKKSEATITSDLNNNQNVDKVTNLIETESLEENTIGEYQVVLKQELDKNLQTLEDGKQIDLAELPGPEHVKHSEAMKKIKDNTSLLEFYLTFEQILTQCTLGSLAANSGKLAIEPGLLSKIGTLVGATGTAGSIVGSILSVIDEEKQKQENKHVADFASTPKIAQEIFSSAAITLALTFENEINTLSVKTLDTSYLAEKLSAPAGAVSFGATLALIALPTLGLPVETKTSNEERAKLLVNTVITHQPSETQIIASKVSKFTALKNMLATKAGNIQKQDGSLVHYSEILKTKAAIVKVDSKITKEELEMDLASLKNENGTLQDKNINLENEVKNLKGTVGSLRDKVAQLEEIKRVMQDKVIAQEQKTVELQSKNEALEKTLANSEAKINGLDKDYYRVSERTKNLGTAIDGLHLQIQNLPALQYQHQQHAQIIAQLQQEPKLTQQMQEQIQHQQQLIQQQFKQMEQLQQQLHNQTQQMQQMQEQLKQMQLVQQQKQQIPQQQTNVHAQPYNPPQHNVHSLHQYNTSPQHNVHDYQQQSYNYSNSPPLQQVYSQYQQPGNYAHQNQYGQAQQLGQFGQQANYSGQPLPLNQQLGVPSPQGQSPTFPGQNNNNIYPQPGYAGNSSTMFPSQKHTPANVIYSSQHNNYPK